LFRSETLGKILKERAGQNAVHKKDLEKFRKEQEAQRQTLKAFEQDELAKSTWVHCPHCNALWAGSDACSHVTCGVLEAKMGGQTGYLGCGRAFDLTEGRKYTPAEPPSLEKLTKPAVNEDGTEVCHEVSCDKCQQKIRGIRVRCLNCPNYNLCVGCLAKRGQSHHAEKRWPRKKHVFHIIHTPNTAYQASDFAEQDRLERADDTQLIEDYNLAVVLRLSLADEMPQGSGSESSGSDSQTSPPAKRSRWDI
jgi:hypothetical protein